LPYIANKWNLSLKISVKKIKVEKIAVRVWTGREVSRRLRLPNLKAVGP